MRLPKYELPQYTTKLPSNDRKVAYRPFTSKEEKPLLMAASDPHGADMQDAVVNLIENCCDVSINDLTDVDVEWLFVKLRSCSVESQSMVSLAVTGCDQEECPKEFTAAVNLDHVKVERPNQDLEAMGFKTKGDKVILPIDDENGLVFNANPSSGESDIEAIYNTLDSVYDPESVYVKSEFSFDEFDEFMRSIPSGVVRKARLFCAAKPRLVCNIEGRCGKCQKEFQHKLVGLDDFFG